MIAPLALSAFMTALLSVAPAHGQPFAFVANYLNGSVSVIDTRANQVVKTIENVGRAVDVTLSHDGRRAYMIEGGGALQVLDTTALTVIGAPVVLGGTESIEAVEAPDGSRVYVVNAITSNISVVDVSSLTEVGTIPLPAGASPASLAITPSGDHLYVANFNFGSISVVDLSASRIVETIPAEAGANGLAISPDGSRVYAANQLAGTVTVVDGLSHVALATVAAGDNPRRVVLSPDGARLYVPNLRDSGTVTVIDATSLEIVQTLDVGPTPTDLALTPDGAIAYVVESGSNTVSVFDTSSAELVETIGVGQSPFGISSLPSCRGADALCLQNDRFRVDVAFRTDDGPFRPAEFEQLTEATGIFWFFDRSNIELVLKVLDACPAYGRFWVFAAGLTDVEVEITVTDTFREVARSYANPRKTAFQPIQDTSAFATCP